MLMFSGHALLSVNELQFLRNSIVEQQSVPKAKESPLRPEIARMRVRSTLPIPKGISG